MSKVVEAGVKRKRRVNGVRERESVAVSCPHQKIDYSETFHLIHKGNGAEAKYELGGQRRSHRWIYLSLIEKHNPGRRPVTMVEGIKEATHALLQRGSKMRTRAQ